VARRSAAATSCCSPADLTSAAAAALARLPESVFFRENTEYGKQAKIPRAFYIDAKLQILNCLGII
jgi:hypothetical protein